MFGLAIIAVILFAPAGHLLGRARPFRRPAARAGTGGPATAPLPHPDYHEAEGEPVLSVRGVSVRFGGLHALTDVSLDVRRGEILGIIGPNGAGKTTLFNVLNGLVRSSASGSARLEGVELLGRSRRSGSARLGVARTFQTVRAFPRLTLVENVVVGAFAAERRDRGRTAPSPRRWWRGWAWPAAAWCRRRSSPAGSCG